MRPGRHLVVPLALGLLLSCSARTGAVEVEPPAPAAPAGTACTRLAGELPDEVEGAARRETAPRSALTAAWGDPPIALRCGTAQPAVDPTSRVVTVDDVEWLLEELPEGYRFTTVGRVAAVEVVVPDAYAPEVNPLVDLAAAVTAALPREPG